MSILIMYPFLQETASASSPTFPNDGVRLLATHTPIVLHVGNLFHIRTFVFNNSPGTISFIAGPCDSPLAATFDKNVLVKHGVGCFAGAASTSASSTFSQIETEDYFVFLPREARLTIS